MRFYNTQITHLVKHGKEFKLYDKYMILMKREESSTEVTTSDLYF